MGHFAAAKTKSYLDLVSCIEKFRQIPHLDVVVADIGSRPEFDLFYSDLFLLFLHEDPIEKALLIPFLGLLYLLFEDVLPGIVLLAADPLFVGLLVDLTAEFFIEFRT